VRLGFYERCATGADGDDSGEHDERSDQVGAGSAPHPQPFTNCHPESAALPGSLDSSP